jgi:SnoaL-like protein
MNSAIETVATNFYSAFKQKNAQGMNKCYHPQLTFEDPAFGKLTYDQTCAMWQMLCTSTKDLIIDFNILKVEKDYVETRWVAEYTLGKNKRFVHNEIIAHMNFAEGKIIKHTDVFNLHNWAKQALGLQGWLLGGSSFFKKKLQQQTNRQLAKYMNKTGDN